jgi:hypothetical protein
LFWETQCSLDDLSIGIDEEVLSDGASTWVIRAKGGESDSRFTIHILLPVDTAHGEDSALVLSQGGILLGYKTVLEDETGEDVAVGGDRQEFGATWVSVRSIETAGSEEEGCTGD